MSRRALPLALLVAGAVLALVLLRVPVRTDMTGFLPPGDTPAARALLDELRDGGSTALILLGIEGAAPAELARVAKAVAATLAADARFASVSGGGEDAGALLALGFAHRYLLSPAVGAETFTEPALAAALAGLLRELRGTGAPLALRFGLADPTGAFPALLRAWAGERAPPRTVDGVWFAPDRDRALLVARTRAGGLDGAAQEAAADAIARAFAAAAPPPDAALLVAGPASFARAAAATIRADVERIAVLSLPLLIGLLLWRFRSVGMLAVAAIPLALGIAAGVAMTGAVWGSVQAAALGFGITILGVAVDYPVLLVGHRAADEPPAATLARIAPAFVPAVATAVLGLGGMAFVGFPGLAQLAALAAVGLLAAAAATWWLLPPLVAAVGIAPPPPDAGGWLDRVEGWRRHRNWLWAALAIVAAALVAAGGPAREGDLAALSPVPEAARATDAALREDLGAADPGTLLFVQGPDAESVLQAQERVLPALDALVAAGAIAGYDAAARLLPSVATQESRRAALPETGVLAARLDAARRGTPFAADAFRPFLDAVAATRAGLPPLRPESLEGAAAARLAPLLGPRPGGGWVGTVAFAGVRDPAALGTLHLPDGVLLVAVKAETEGIVARAGGRALGWLAAGAAAALAALLLGLRDGVRVLRVVGAVAAGALLTVAVLAGAGVRFSLLHLVALQLLVGLGLDYALFFARPQLDRAERLRTMRTLLTCCAATLIGFGPLAFCATPFLREIGVTVALGAALMLGCAFLLAGERPMRPLR